MSWKILETLPPPTAVFDISIVHKIRELYKKIYSLGKQLSKGNKLGIHKEIENKIISSFSLCIKAVYENKNLKITTLEILRIEIEVLKQLIRSEYEMKIILNKKYLELEKDLQEISKMTNGWIKYIKTQNPA